MLVFHDIVEEHAEKENLEDYDFSKHVYSEVEGEKFVDGLGANQLRESQKCLDRAETSLKEGFMWLVRSVALPETF